jgi:hypothetical protein
MSARRRDVRHRLLGFGYGFRCTHRWVSIMGWPFTTAWATIFVVFLARIGRANDVPPDAVTIIRREPRRPAARFGREYPRAKRADVGIGRAPSVTAFKADTWIVPDIDGLPNKNGARPSVSA